MNLITIFMMAIGLSFDTFAVSLTLGTSKSCTDIRKSLGMALYFGFFQSLMLFLGLIAGLGIRVFVESFAHLIAFFLLVIVGLKMIYESTILKKKNENCSSTGFPVLTGLALATSIDALSVGFSYSLLNDNFFIPLTVLGLVTFTAAISGITIGKRLGIVFGKRLEIIGGIVLIIIAVRVITVF